MNLRADLPAEIARLVVRRRVVTDLRWSSAITPSSDLVVVDRAALGGPAIDVLAGARGVVDPAVALVVLGPGGADDALDGAGWFLERSDEQLAVYRLPWSAEDLAAAEWRRDPMAPVDVIVRLDDHVDALVEAAYRCAVPGSLEIEVVVGAARPERPVASDAVELVAPAAAFPEAGWIQALLDALDGEPVGCALATSAGRIVHAGASAGGRAVAAGASVGHDPLPEVTARRRLLPPYARRQATVPPEPRAVIGTHLGGVAALVSPSDAPSPTPAPLREVLAGAVLIVTDHLGSEHPPEWLRDAGALGPVVVWVDQRVAPELVERYAVDGVCVVGPWTSLTGVEGIDLDRWVGATGPSVIAYLSAALVERSFAAAASHGAQAFVAWIGEGACPVPERFDAQVAPHELVAAVQHRPVVVNGATALRPIVERETKDDLVSVVVPVHGQRALTERCVASLRATVPGDLEIVIVDDASPDDTATWLATRPDLTVVTNERNLGFAASVNRGIDEASGELVCILNNDTEVVEGWLDALLGQLAVPGTGLVGPRSNAVAGRQMVPGAPPMTAPDAARTWGAEHAADRAHLGFEVGSLMGLCLLAPRDLFVGLGGLDERYGLGNGEDLELCERVRRAGLRLRVADGAVVLHHGSATFRSIATDYGSLLLDGNRHAPPQLSSRSDRWGIVVSDGQPYGTAATVDSLLPLVDRVLVVERAAVHPTELAIGNFACLGAEVVAWDWHHQPLHPLVAGQDASIVVLEAGEVASYDDWGLVRAELETLRDGAAAVRTASGPSRRVIPAADDPLDWVGRRPAPELRTMTIETGSRRP